MRQSCRRSLLADQKENGKKAGFGFRRLRFPFRAPKSGRESDKKQTGTCGPSVPLRGGTKWETSLQLGLSVRDGERGG